MTGPQLLIFAIIAALVIACGITVAVINVQNRQIIDTNSDLVRQNNALLEKNRSQQDKLDQLQKQQEQIVAMMQERARDEVTLLRQQTQRRRNELQRTAEMTDGELMAWVEQKMDESRAFTSPNFTLKEMAKAVGLTQKRLTQLLREQAQRTSFSDYLTRKRLLFACKLMRENPNWTIEAIAKDSGFQTRRTFQEVVKTHLGMTPSQYRQTLE